MCLVMLLKIKKMKQRVMINSHSGAGPARTGLEFRP